MKIVDLRATPVTVPAEAPWRWSMGIETGTTRTIVELITDEGIVGLGETYGGVRTDRGARDRQAVHRRSRSTRDRTPPAPPRRVLHRLRDERAAARPGGHRDGLPGRGREGPRPVRCVAARWGRPRRGRRRQLPVLSLRVRGRPPAGGRQRRGHPRPGERAGRAQRPSVAQAEGRGPQPGRGVSRAQAPARPVPGRPTRLGPERRLVGRDDDPRRATIDRRCVRAAMARGSVPLARRDEPGSCRRPASRSQRTCA